MRDPFGFCSILQLEFGEFVLRIFRLINLYEINSFRLVQQTKGFHNMAWWHGKLEIYISYLSITII